MIQFSFRLFELKWGDDKWLDLCEFELDTSPYCRGSLFLVARMYSGSWQFDLLFFSLFRGLYNNLFDE